MSCVVEILSLVKDEITSTHFADTRTLYVIHYFTVLSHTASDTYAKVMEVYSDSISYDIVKRWRCEFLTGRMEIADELYEG